MPGLGLNGKNTSGPYDDMVNIEWFLTRILIEFDVVKDSPAVSQKLVEFLADSPLTEESESAIAKPQTQFPEGERKKRKNSKSENNKGGTQNQSIKCYPCSKTDENAADQRR